MANTFELPKMNPQIQGGQNIPEEVFKVPLEGQWMPSTEDMKIGKDFKTLTNMRYSTEHPSSILGMTKVNQTALPTYLKVRSAFQFKKDTPIENHILVQAYNAAMTGAKIYNNTNTGIIGDNVYFQTNNSVPGSDYASRYYDTTSPPNTFSLELETLFSAIGTKANNDYGYLSYTTAAGAGAWRLGIIFASDGLYIQKAAAATTEVGSDIVKCNSTATWQTWRFQVNKTTVSSATVEVFLNNISQGTVDCDYETGGTGGRVLYTQYGTTTNYRESAVRYVKIASGLGAII